MKKICMSFVFMFSMLQLSASQDNPIISTMAFTSSIAFIAWMQQPVWVKQLGKKIEERCEKSDITIDVKQYNLQNNDEAFREKTETLFDSCTDGQLNYHEGQNILSSVDSRVYSSLESENNYNKDDADDNEEVASLLSSSMVYITPADYSKETSF